MKEINTLACEGSTCVETSNGYRAYSIRFTYNVGNACQKPLFGVVIPSSSVVVADSAHQTRSLTASCVKKFTRIFIFNRQKNTK